MMISEKSRIMGMFSQKDLDLKIITCNKAVVEYTGLKSIDNVIGRTDYDLCWHEYAETYVTHEKDGLMGNNYSMITLVKDHTGCEAINLDTKVGKTDDAGNIAGVFCRSIEIINPAWNELLALLTKNSPFDKHHYYIEKSNFSQFSKKESEVLFYLTHGKRPKTIAVILNRSVRTIEHHIEKAKEKSNCKTTGELIVFAIAHGFRENLPRDTLKSLIEKMKDY